MKVFFEQVERYAQKDTREISAVVSISAWTATNGFDTNVFYHMSPRQTQVAELVAIQVAFDARYMQMMTQMVQGRLPDGTESSQAVGTIAFSKGGIDFAWQAPRLPLPWDRRSEN